MKKSYISFSVILICGLILAACTPQSQPQAPQPPAVEVPTTQPQATEPPTAVPVSPAPSPTVAAPSIKHTDVPGDLPAKGGLNLGDNTITSQADKQRALNGDGFTDGRLERPFNADTMDVFSQFLDITGATFYADDATWVYSNITLAGVDANNALSGKYGLELDLNQDGRGDFLILADHPSSKDWTTDGVQVFSDANHDVGGSRPFVSDSTATGDGYETLVFDQGKGDDPDIAWVRLNSNDPNSIQFAFKKSLINNEKTFLVGVWAGADLNPALFDYNDHFTHAQAGAALKSLTEFYPIKAVFNIDNTCRLGIGFTPAGNVPGACPTK